MSHSITEYSLSSRIGLYVPESDVPRIASEILRGTHGLHIDSHVPVDIACREVIQYADEKASREQKHILLDLIRARNCLLLNTVGDIDHQCRVAYSAGNDNEKQKLRELVRSVPPSMRSTCLVSTYPEGMYSHRLPLGVDGRFYIVSDSKAAAGMGILSCAETLPNGVRDVIVISPHMMEHPALKKEIAALEHYCQCLHDERTTPWLSTVSQHGMPWQEVREKELCGFRDALA